MKYNLIAEVPAKKIEITRLSEQIYIDVIPDQEGNIKILEYKKISFFGLNQFKLVAEYEIKKTQISTAVKVLFTLGVVFFSAKVLLKAFEKMVQEHYKKQQEPKQ